MKIVSFLLAVCLLAACSANTTRDNKTHKAYKVPAGGTVVAADSMKIDDPLNDFYFTVRLISSKENDEPGTVSIHYDIQADFGPNIANGKIVMPRGANDLPLSLRRAADGSYNYTIGFTTGGDTSFHEYYLVKGTKSAIEIKPLKAYSFE